MMKNLPQGWKIEKLGDVCQTGSGGTPSRSNESFFKGDIPWIKSGELNQTVIYRTDEHISEEALKKSSAKIIEPETVLLAMYGATVGATAITKIRATTNQAVCFLIPFDFGLDNRFLFWFLKSNRQSLISQSVGGGQPNISQAIIKNLSIPLPPLPQQEKIVSVLDTASALVEKQKVLLKKYDLFLKSKFIEMFGDPVKNPMGWEVVKLGSITKNLDSERIPIASNERKSIQNGYPYYGASGIIDYVDEYIFDGRYILISEDGENLRARTKPIAFRANGKIWVNNHCHIMQTKNIDMDVFLEFLINATDMSASLSGSTQPKLNQKNLNNIQMILPDDTVLSKFAVIALQTEALKQKEQQKLEKLQTLYDALMKRAFDGEIK